MFDTPRANPIPSVHRWRLTCCSWWSATNWFLMPTRTTLRSKGFADPQILPTSARKCPPVSMRFWLGWHPIGCCWITPRLKFSGAYLLVDNIRSSLQVWSALALLTCSQFLRSTTSVSTSMLTRLWGPTSQPSPERAPRRYVRSGACGDLCHDTPCWPWFVHSLSGVLRWEPAPDMKRRHSTSSALCWLSR